MIRDLLKPALLIFVILTLITGVLYPLLITGIAHGFFRQQAEGSLIYRDAKIAGSILIGQSFSDPKYLWGRLSATSPVAYNAASSSGSNIGPSNSVLLENAKERIEKLRSAEPRNKNPVPVDLVTSSASGLDPQVSQAAAYYQIPRIARERKISVSAVKVIVDRNTTGPFLGLLGETVVNVLKVNLDLDSYKK